MSVAARVMFCSFRTSSRRASVQRGKLQTEVALNQLGNASQKILPHLLVAALLQFPLAVDLVVLRLAGAEEPWRDRKVAVDGVLYLGAAAALDQLQAEIFAELRVELLLRHRDAGQVAQRVEAAVKQILHLQDFGIVRDGFDHAELRPGLELEAENRQRALVLRIHTLRRDADLVRQRLEADVMMILLHRDPAGEPLRIRRGGEPDRRLVEYLCAVQLVDR